MLRYLQTENAGFVVILETAREQGVGAVGCRGVHIVLAQCCLPTVTAGFLSTPMEGAMSV